MKNFWIVSLLLALSVSSAFAGFYPKRSCEMLLLTNGERSYEARFHFAEKAKKRIWFQALIFRADEVGLAWGEVLKKKKAEGLDVRVIVDASSNLDFATQAMYYDLKQHGVEVEGYEALYLQIINELDLFNPGNLDHRWHEKWIIFDDDLVLGGGMNEAAEYGRIGWKAEDRWRDQDILIRDKKITDDTAEAFEQNFKHFKYIKETHMDLFNTDNYWKGWRAVLKWARMRPNLKFLIPQDRLKKFETELRIAKSAQAEFEFVQGIAQLVHHMPRKKDYSGHLAYLNIIDEAHREIVIDNAYLIADPEIVAALHRAALRGVKIYIKTNGKKTNDLPPLTRVARYRYLDFLKINQDEHVVNAVGGPALYLHEWEGTLNEGTSHAKFIVVDRIKGIVGSYNLDPRSRYINSESLFPFEQPQMAQELVDQFRQDLRKSKRITWAQAEKFRNPSNPVEWVLLKLSLPLEREL